MFALVYQFLVVVFNDWIALSSTQRGHIKRCSDTGSATLNTPFASILAAVAIDRRHTHQPSPVGRNNQRALRRMKININNRTVLPQ